MSPSDEKSATDPLEPVLRDAEGALRSRLREACEAEASGLSTESTSEIRRLEDSLLAAAVAAEQTIALRRHIDQRKSERTASTMPITQPTGADPNATGEPVPKVREFRDAEGQLWRAWPVTPGLARRSRTAERYLGEFHKGWICFEALESNARRRLPKQPERWTELKEPELCQLLDQAINAPERRRLKEGPDASHPPLQ
ncbi:MAG TPA: hypothetical protein VGH98_09080 [Gemmatimonadaceae bacterium]|jgi:hypothetical protein